MVVRPRREWPAADAPAVRPAARLCKGGWQACRCEDPLRVASGFRRLSGCAARGRSARRRSDAAARGDGRRLEAAQGRSGEGCSSCTREGRGDSAAAARCGGDGLHLGAAAAATVTDATRKGRARAATLRLAAAGGKEIQRHGAAARLRAATSHRCGRARQQTGAGAIQCDRLAAIRRQGERHRLAAGQLATIGRSHGARVRAEISRAQARDQRAEAARCGA